MSNDTVVNSAPATEAQEPKAKLTGSKGDFGGAVGERSGRRFLVTRPRR